MRGALPFLMAALVAGPLCLCAKPTADAMALPAARSFTLPCGLRVQLLEDHERPMVRFELRVELDPPSAEAMPPLRDLGFTLLRTGGSGHRSRQEFERALDGLGLELRQEREALSIHWSLLARSRDQDLAMGLLADLVLRPAFDGTALELERGRYYDRLHQATPLAQAEESFRLAQMGVAAPTEQALGALTTADFGAWHRRTLRPERATLVLYGDLDLAQARQLATLNLGTWSADPAVPAAAPLPPTTAPIAVPLTGAPTEVRAALGPVSADAILLLPWAQARLAAQGVELQWPGNLLSARLRGGVGDSAKTLQATLVAALSTLSAGPAESDLAHLRMEELIQARLRPLHPANWVEELASHPALPPLDKAAEWAKRWSSPKAFLWIGDPAAYLQGATPKREAKSK